MWSIIYIFLLAGSGPFLERSFYGIPIYQNFYFWFWQMKSWEDFNISQLTLEFLCSFNFLSKKYFGANIPIVPTLLAYMFLLCQLLQNMCENVSWHLNLWLKYDNGVEGWNCPRAGDMLPESVNCNTIDLGWSSLLDLHNCTPSWSFSLTP